MSRKRANFVHSSAQMTKKCLTLLQPADKSAAPAIPEGPNLINSKPKAYGEVRLASQGRHWEQAWFLPLWNPCDRFGPFCVAPNPRPYPYSTPSDVLERPTLLSKLPKLSSPLATHPIVRSCAPWLLVSGWL
jgi:hypothetical protein